MTELKIFLYHPLQYLHTARQFEEALTKDETNTIVEPASTYKYNIGGEKTGTFLTKTDNGISQYGTQTFNVKKNGDAYVLNFRDSTKTFDTSETQMIMNKILQSFKFLN